MARDVEFDALAHDKTGPGLASAERNFARTADRIRREQERNAKAFERNVDRIAGSRVGQLLGENLTRGIVRATPQIAAAAGAAGIAAVPVLAGTLSAAVVGGIGIGGVVGGVALAARDARVQAAGAQLGRTMLASLEDRAAVFVQPVLRSIDLIDRKFRESGSTLDRIFRNSARLVEPLTDAVTDAMQSVLAGVATVTDRAGPAVRAIADGVRETGDALNAFLDDISRNGESTARSLESMFDTLNGTIRVTGQVLGFLNDTFATLDRIMPLSLFTQLERLMGKTDETTRRTGSGTFELAGGFQRAAASGDDLAATVREAEAATRALYDANRSLYASQTSTAEAIARTTETIRENGRGLSLNTEKGRENRRALSDLATSLNANYEAYVRVNGAGAGAQAVADRNRAAFQRLAERAGYTAGQARRLADELLGIPARRDTKIQANTAAAQSEVRNFRSELLSIPTSRTVTITTRFRGDGANQNSPSIGGGGGRTFDAAAYWQAADQRGSGHRTAPPTPVDVSNRVDVFLDGEPFRRQTARVVDESNRRERWRQRVGGRY